MSESIGTLYSWYGHLYSTRIFAAAAVAGIKIDLADGYTHKETNKTPEFLAKFPVGKVPAFHGKDGFRLVESSAIARYVANLAPNSGLLGTNIQEAALVDQWSAFADLELDAHRRAVLGLFSGSVPYFKPIDVLTRERLLTALDVLDKVLLTRTYLVGHRLTLADITVATILQKLFQTLLGVAERAKIPNVVRHFDTVVNQTALKPVFGTTQFVEKAQQYVALPSLQRKSTCSRPCPPKGEARPKARAAPAAQEDEEDEPSAPEEPKAKNPLDLLPKSTLNLEDWKRAYSNLDTRGPGGSLEWFYEKYDPEGFSLWKVSYKYPEDLTQVFMSSNLIGGFFNRLEASRKYLFGSLGVLGTSNNSLIEGVLIARGTDIKPVVEVAPDFESYNYEKIDLANAAQKAYFEAALAWDLEVAGKKWADGKNVSRRISFPLLIEY
ncbi:hypothetical protein BS47DRAFT_1372929 [Hydnum rufescens UP504]|uniref:Elongation factor 1-gamma n=1 Tax=Hydnum rufescens UP504 TaxID=1448309 RepID=A0A9P6AWB1_9AGAM|nr:hypothetical protein BS47DRAFT_1372929 [Hydnum rufescens UP504]